MKQSQRNIVSRKYRERPESVEITLLLFIILDGSGNDASDSNCLT